MLKAEQEQNSRLRDVNRGLQEKIEEKETELQRKATSQRKEDNSKLIAKLKEVQ